jgi:hypothetical protein
MSNKRITDLTELTTPTTDDVFPVVDIATNTTTKVQLANLPVQTAVTTALATKQDTLVSGTNIKTVNSTSLVGSGNVAVQPTLVSGTNIKTLNSVSLLGAGDIVLTATPSGVSGAIQFSNGSAFASDAANIFWDNTNKRLGVGTNTPTATGHFKGSGSTSATTSLLVQNSAGFSAITVTDDLKVNINSLVFGGNNGYIGINNSPSIDTALRNIRTDAGTSPLSISTGEVGVGDTTTYASAIFAIGSTTRGFLPPRMTTTQRDAIVTPATGLSVYNTTLGTMDTYDGATWQRIGKQTLIKGAGTTSATTALLVQNSGGTNLLTVRDDGVSTFNGNTTVTGTLTVTQDVGLSNTVIFWASGYQIRNTANGFVFTGAGGAATGALGLGMTSGTGINASCILQADSTTKGFLPPRMTTTQRDAITSPASGLMIYNTTTAKLNVFTTAWETITSL